MDVFDAAMRYKKEGRDLIVLAGKDYGSGSSRDWAAKGPWMLVRPLLLYRFVTFICDWQTLYLVILQTHVRMYRMNYQ